MSYFAASLLSEHRVPSIFSRCYRFPIIYVPYTSHVFPYDFPYVFPHVSHMLLFFYVCFPFFICFPRDLVFHERCGSPRAFGVPGQRGWALQRLPSQVYSGSAGSNWNSWVGGVGGLLSMDIHGWLSIFVGSFLCKSQGEVP